jgi:hypothetical protein
MSIVRDNLETRKGYTPYCGSDCCRKGWPRTSFDGSQFCCKCGWRSQIDKETIEKYKRFNQTKTAFGWE